MRKLGTDFELHFTSGLKWSRTMRAEKNMTALGRIMEESEIVKAYQWCDALLFPSRLEGFGLAALEAMACGKPVIATNTSSLPEVVENGVSGILCPPDDIGAFAVACGKLADSDETGVRYGQAGRRRAVELFSEDHIIPQYIKLYEKLLRA
jgi:glycosyltransferase involved in cell wall biosynthesis